MIGFWLLYLAMGGSLFVLSAGDGGKISIVLDDVKRDLGLDEKEAMPIVMAIALVGSILLWPLVLAHFYNRFK